MFDLPLIIKQSPTTGEECYTMNRLRDRRSSVDASPLSILRATIERRRSGIETVPEQTYEVIELHYNSLKKKITSLARRAAKLGAVPLALTVLDTYWKEHKGARLKVYKVRVVGDMPDTNGWSFVAQLSHREEANIIRRRDNAAVSDEALLAYRSGGANCGHCDVKRMRHQTYVMHHEETGETIQVGSSCLEQFLGGTPKAALYYFDGTEAIGKLASNGLEISDADLITYGGVDLRDALSRSGLKKDVDAVLSWLDTTFLDGSGNALKFDDVKQHNIATVVHERIVSAYDWHVIDDIVEAYAGRKARAAREREQQEIAERLSIPFAIRVRDMLVGCGIDSGIDNPHLKDELTFDASALERFIKGNYDAWLKLSADIASEATLAPGDIAPHDMLRKCGDKLADNGAVLSVSVRIYRVHTYQRNGRTNAAINAQDNRGRVLSFFATGDAVEDYAEGARLQLQVKVKDHTYNRFEKCDTTNVTVL